MANNTSSERRPAARFFIGLIKFLFLILFIGAGAVLGLVAWQQMTATSQLTQRLNDRISNVSAAVVDEGRIEAMILAETSELNSRINGLSTDLAAAERQNNALQETVNALSATVDAQAEELAASQESLDGRLTTVEEGATILGSAASALQGDLGDLGADVANVDANLGGLADSLATLEENVSALEGTLATLETASIAADEASGEEESTTDTDAPAPVIAVDYGTELALLRLSGLVMRTKLHIAEEDISAASSSLETAQTAVANLLDTDDGANEDGLTAVQEALDAASADLEEKPALANLSLDEAMDSLDALLAP